MECLEGPALDEVLAQRRLPWAEALEYTVAAARGLRAALAHGFIHRDVKPSNLMLDREAGIKILDFGLVKSLHGDAELTRDGAIIGSPLYMAPEQGRGEDVDHRADIYSLGCALYHMLTGRPPFYGPVAGGRHRHAHDRSRRAGAQPGARRPRAPAAAWSTRMMAKTPADRFAELRRAHRRPRGAPARRNASSPGFKTRAVALAVDLAPHRRCWAPSCRPLGLPAVAAYFIVCHRLTGQTLGKRLLRLAVTDRSGRRLSWKSVGPALPGLRLGTAWPRPLLAGLRLLRPPPRAGLLRAIGSLTSEQLAEPLLYLGLAAVIFVAYLAGFLVAAFHPKKLALHDLLCGTEVRYKGSRDHQPGRALPESDDPVPALAACWCARARRQLAAVAAARGR